MIISTEACGYRMLIKHSSALQIVSEKNRGDRHKYHPTLLSIKLLLQLKTIVTYVFHHIIQLYTATTTSLLTH